jgi:hypothetical protein
MARMGTLITAAVVIASTSAFSTAQAQSGPTSDQQMGTNCLQSPKVLAPMSGESVHLSRFDGVVYYTREKDGYRVVATLASGPGDLPVRFIATLMPEQHIAISVPQDVGQPSIDFAITRAMDMLVVGYTAPCPATH